ncbi:MAG: hypothetical protein ABI641_07860, partial [Caldimonas sp.]
DRHGVIDLDLPVSGSINDPQFSLGGVIWKVVSNLIVKAVTAPFSLLASALGGESAAGASHVSFALGSADLSGDARASLDKVAAALVERPQLTLTIVGESSGERERDAWKRQRLQQIVRAEKRRASGGAGGRPDPSVTVSAEEYPALLKEVYKRADLDTKPKNALGLAKDLPTAEMESLLLAGITVADSVMPQLAVRRAVAVRDYLASRDVAAARLFLGAPKVVEAAGADWAPRAALDLAAS